MKGQYIRTEKHIKQLSIGLKNNKNGRGNKGYHPSEEAIKNMSESHKGHKHSEETKRRMSESRKGRPLSLIHRIRIGESNKGKIRTQETKRKLSIINIGKHHSEETKLKMSIVHKGFKHSKESVYTGVQTRLRNGSYCVSKETRNKISNSHKGKHLSQNTKIKQRHSMIRYIKTIGNSIIPLLGHNEKQILDKLEIELNYKILRQYVVDRFFIDGYIPSLNLAIEIDEKYHKKFIDNDIIRQKIIEDELGCEFIRINDYD